MKQNRITVIANSDKISDVEFVDWNSIDVSSVNTKQAAVNYCVGYLGMTAAQVDSLIDTIVAVG